MAKNDFSILAPSATGAGLPVTSQYIVAKGTTSSINAGEFVLKNVGAGNYAAAFTASSATQPVVGTDYVAGLAMSTSTETTSATGVVEVMQFQPGVIYLGNPKTAANFGQGTTPSQAVYNNQVGKRVLIDVTSGVMTVLNTDGWSASTGKNGLIVEYIDVTQYPGKVAFRLAQGLSYLNQA